DAAATGYPTTTSPSISTGSHAATAAAGRWCAGNPVGTGCAAAYVIAVIGRSARRVRTASAARPRRREGLGRSERRNSMTLLDEARGTAQQMVTCLLAGDREGALQLFARTKSETLLALAMADLCAYVHH